MSQIRTEDPELTRITSASGEVLECNSGLSEPVFTDIQSIQYVDENGILRIVSVGDRLVGDGGVVIGEVSAIAACEEVHGGVHHSITIDYASGNLDGVEYEGGLPLGEYSEQVSNRDMTTFR